MAESICEEVLLGPWYKHERVIQVVLPLIELLTAGVAHIKLTPLRKRLMKQCSWCAEWLERVEDGEQEFLDLLGSPKEVILATYPNAMISMPAIKRIDWEANNWHYDIHSPLTTDADYNIPNTVTPDKRHGRADQEFLLTIPFPIDFQGPSVVHPWAGPYEGQPVQCPPGYATIFDLHACWHRGDRWSGGRRGLYHQGVRIPQ